MRGRTARRNVLEWCLIVCSGVTLMALAADATSAAEGKRLAHVHGVGKLNVAIEDEEVEMELIMPGADIVGFEHAPETMENKAAVADAVAALQDGALLFSFSPEAGCRLGAVEVESAQLDHGHTEDEERAHGAEKADREQVEGGEEHQGVEHAQFHARYHFHCERPDRLQHVDVRLLQRFPAVQELEVQTTSSRGQSATELTPSSARLKF
jgi:hypothetical protein